MPSSNNQIEKRLWDAADELRANSRLRASDYSRPVLGLIFLRYAGHRFDQAHQEILAERAAATRAGVRVAIEDAIWQLPDCFSDDLCQKKTAVVYQHIYDNYQSATQSTYVMVA